MSSESTTALEVQLRTRLLTFSPLLGATLVDTIGSTASGPGIDGRLYWDQAPDGIATANPSVWGVMALKNRRPANVGDGQESILAELEVQWFCRPRSAKATINTAADLCDQAMLRYVDASSGVIANWGARRFPLPPFPAPADRDLAQIMCSYTLVLWPQYLTQYHDET